MSTIASLMVKIESNISGLTKGLQETETRLKNFSSSAQAASDAISQNMTFMTSLIGQFTEVDPATQQWLTTLTESAAVMSETFIFIAALSAGLAEMAALFAMVSTAVGALIGWVGLVIEAFALWAAGAGTFVECMLLITNPIGWIVAAIIALIAVGWLLITNWSEISAFFVNAWSRMSEIAIQVWNSISATTITVWNAIIGFLTGIWISITSAMSLAWDSIKNTSESVWNSLITFFSSTVPAGFQALIQFFTDLQGKIGVFLYQLFFVDIPFFIGYGIGYMIEFLTINIPLLMQFFMDLPENIWIWLVKVVEKFVTFASNFIVAAVKFGGDVITSIIDFIKTMPDKIWEWLVAVSTKFNEWNTDVTETAKKIGASVFNGIIDFIKALPGNIWDLLLTLSTKIGEFETLVTDKAKSIGTAIYNGIIDFVKSIPQKVDDLLGGVVSKILSIASSIGSAIGSIFSNGQAGIDAGKAAANAASSPTSQTIKHADGGIFTKPTMIGNHLFGENGPEVLQPLSKLNQGGSNQPITVYLDGAKIYEGTDRQLGNAFVAFGGV